MLINMPIIYNSYHTKFLDHTPILELEVKFNITKIHSVHVSV
jgi:hypothetical protein